MMTVRDVMTTAVLTVRRDMPLKDVARLLIDGGIAGAPVVDEAGVVCGVISEGDFLVKEQGPTALRHRRLATLAEAHGQSGQVKHQGIGREAVDPLDLCQPAFH